MIWKGWRKSTEKMKLYRNRFNTGETLMVIDHVTHVVFREDQETMDIFYISGEKEHYTNVTRRSYEQLMNAIYDLNKEKEEPKSEIDKILGT